MVHIINKNFERYSVILERKKYGYPFFFFSFYLKKKPNDTMVNIFKIGSDIELVRLLSNGSTAQTSMELRLKQSVNSAGSWFNRFNHLFDAFLRHLPLTKSNELLKNQSKSKFRKILPMVNSSIITTFNINRILFSQKIKKTTNVL